MFRLYRMACLVLVGGLVIMGCNKKKAEESAPNQSVEPAAARPQAEPVGDKEAASIVAAYTKKFAALEKKLNLAWWRAYTGDKAAYAEKEKLELAMRRLQSDRKVFARLKELRKPGKVSDPLLRRQIDHMYWAFLENQIDPKLMQQLVAKSTEVEKVFNEFRAKMNGKEVKRNDIEEILSNSRNAKLRKAAWEASKQVGARVAPMVVALVKLRNKAAKSLGFKSYYEMQLRIQEEDPAKIAAIFEELDRLTADPFKTAKARLDSLLAKRYHVRPEALMPWHYEDPFFQEVPKIAVVDMDPYYKKIDPEALATKFYKGLGMDVTDIIERSDLYPKKGKSQHAFCTDIDRSGDVRVLANLAKNERWTSTLLHELGHGVYFKYIDRKLPYLLREPAHIFTTEGIAMMFERVIYNSDWLETMGIVTKAQAAKLAPELEQARILQGLVFARWTLVMVNFERRLYDDPDQDLDKLWWDLVEKYQFVRRPAGRKAPDWAAKTHIVSAPAYYHNYMLGYLFNSQLLEHIATKVVARKGIAPTKLTFIGMPEVGRFLMQKVFAPGARWAWPEYVRRVTGSPLSAKAFARQYVASQEKGAAKTDGRKTAVSGKKQGSGSMKAKARKASK